MKFIYKDKEYTLNDLEKEHKKFAKSIKNPSFLLSNRFPLTFAFDPGYNIASDFFYDLYKQITSAKFALIMGHKKIHDRNFVNWESGATGQYWLRFQYIKNSIIWYNSSFDILLQTLWFGFSLYKRIKINKKRINEIDSSETYKDLLTACTYSKVKKVLKQINNPDSTDLLNEIDNYSKCNEREKINAWSNKLKHHGDFIISELYSPSFGMKTGKYNSIYSNPEINEIEKLIEILKKHHLKLLKLTKFIFDFFNFDFFEKEEINIADIPKEIEYKRIIIENDCP